MRAAQEAQSTTRPIPSIAPTIIVSTGSDSKTAFFSTRVVQPTASEEAQISRYDELLRAFHQLNVERLQALQLVQQRFDQERAQIEATLQRDEEQAINGLKRVHEAVRTLQEKLEHNGWRNVISNTIVPAIQVPGNLELMSEAQRSALNASQEISSSIDGYKERKEKYPRVNGFYWSSGYINRADLRSIRCSGLVTTFFGGELGFLKSSNNTYICRSCCLPPCVDRYPLVA